MRDGLRQLTVRIAFANLGRATSDPRRANMASLVAIAVAAGFPGALLRLRAVPGAVSRTSSSLRHCTTSLLSCLGMIMNLTMNLAGGGQLIWVR